MPRKQTHCKNGHDLSKTRVYKKNSKNTYCSECYDLYGRAYMRLRRYGITQSQYLELLERQEYKCALCHSLEWGGYRNTPCIDHCHSTGKVRSILCHSCNIGLGMFKDSPQLLAKAISYLNKHS